MTYKSEATKKLQVKNDKYREEYDRIFMPKNKSVACPTCHKIWTTSDENALIKCIWCGNMFAVKVG